MAHFETNKQASKRKGPLLSISFFLILFFIFFLSIEALSDDTRQRQKESLENAISQSIVYCYTLEGSYPESLEYLKEHYGLTYNEDLFFVDYRLQGANILPDVTIIDRGER